MSDIVASKWSSYTDKIYSVNSFRHCILVLLWYGKIHNCIKQRWRYSATYLLHQLMDNVLASRYQVAHSLENMTMNELLQLAPLLYLPGLMLIPMIATCVTAIMNTNSYNIDYRFMSLGEVISTWGLWNYECQIKIKG